MNGSINRSINQTMTEYGDIDYWFFQLKGFQIFLQKIFKLNTTPLGSHICLPGNNLIDM